MNQEDKTNQTKQQLYGKKWILFFPYNFCADAQFTLLIVIFQI